MTKKKAVFLDRDGVINKERKDYVKTKDELEIFSNVHECIKKIKQGDFLAVVITNQSAINRGLSSHQNIQEIHDEIQKYLKSNGTSIDNFFYCPHRPDEKCYCRKPNPGLIFEAAKKLNIDLSKSWMIGDKDTDVKAAKLAGCVGIKIDENFLLDNAIERILKI